MLQVGNKKKTSIHLISQCNVNFCCCFDSFGRLPVTKFEDSSAAATNLSKTEVGPDISEDFKNDFFGDNEVAEEASSSTRSREFDPSVDLSVDIYCELLNSLEQECWESNLAEFWGFNATEIESLTKEDILAKLNSGRVIR